VTLNKELPGDQALANRRAVAGFSIVSAGDIKRVEHCGPLVGRRLLIR
jgi:hypothetical protein